MIGLGRSDRWLRIRCYFILLRDGAKTYADNLQTSLFPFPSRTDVSSPFLPPPNPPLYTGNLPLEPPYPSCHIHQTNHRSSLVKPVGSSIHLSSTATNPPPPGHLSSIPALATPYVRLSHEVPDRMEPACGASGQALRMLAVAEPHLRLDMADSIQVRPAKPGAGRASDLLTAVAMHTNLDTVDPIPLPRVPLVAAVQMDMDPGYSIQTETASNLPLPSDCQLQTNRILPSSRLTSRCKVQLFRRQSLPTPPFFPFPF